jgi:hypothetical protein
VLGTDIDRFGVGTEAEETVVVAGYESPHSRVSQHRSTGTLQCGVIRPERLDGDLEDLLARRRPAIDQERLRPARHCRTATQSIAGTNPTPNRRMSPPPMLAPAEAAVTTR